MSASMTCGDAYRRQIIIIITCLADDCAKTPSINLPSSFDALPSRRYSTEEISAERGEIGSKLEIV